MAVDDSLLTSDPHVSAVGEVAAHRGGRPYGLVAPGYRQADVVADRLAGRTAAFTGADTSTKLKLLGVDVASVGDCFAATEGSQEIVYADPVAGVYKKLVLSGDGTRILGGVLVGDATAYASVLQYAPQRHPGARQPRAAHPPRRRRRGRRPHAGRPARRRHHLLVPQRHEGGDLRRHLGR